MKKLFLLFMALLATTTLWAHDFEVDGVYYNSLDGNNVAVTYKGNNASSYSDEYSSEVTIPATVTYDGTTYSVTSIGDNAFYWCSSLASITIPNSVTSIGNYAFYNCYSLSSITIPNSVTSIGNYAFRDCSSLTSITIPNSVMNIGNAALLNTGIYNDESSWENGVLYVDNCLIHSNQTLSGSYSIKDGTRLIADGAFSNQTSLTSIIIPESVVAIGINAFDGCVFLKFINKSFLDEETNHYWGAQIADLEIDGLFIRNDTVIDCREDVVSVTIPNTIKTIGDDAFDGCSSLTSITIPNSVTSIGGWAFGYCSSLTSITIGNSVTSIGYSAFYGCSSLTSVTIPNSVTSIGYSAFDGCSGLTSVTIGNSVTSIGWGAFYDCSSLTSITIPNSVTSIGDNAFSWCSSLASVTIPNSVTSIGRGAFYGCSSLTSITIPNSVTSIGSSAFSDCSSLTSITIPKSVTSIGSMAFDACFSLTSITIPNSVTSIEDGTFYDCHKLSSITIPNSVMSIGDDAFYNCFSLTSITIPNSVTSIGDYAFYDCDALDSIRVEATTPPVLESHAFSYTTISLCYIPCGTSIPYKVSDWAQCVDEFVELGCDQCGDDLRWEYDGTQLSITGYGEMYDYDIDPQPWQESRNKITQLSLPDGMTSVGAAAFADCKFLNNATIPSSVKEIRYSAFEDCRSLSSLTFVEPSALTSIGNWAFYNCHKLQHVTIPEGVTEIGEAAFFDCTYLDELTLPVSMEYIADNGFALCAKLRRMNVNATTPPQVEARTFEDVDRTIPVVVPDESVSVYKSAPVWQEFNIVGKNNVPSAVDNVDASNRSTQKLLRDGHLVIIRDGVEYNVMGQEL